MKIGLIPSESSVPFTQMKAQALAGEAKGGIWEAFTLLAGLAAVTQRIQL